MAAAADAVGQGCPGRHEPSRSRAAIPASRMRGPSAHHMGPSPSATCVGVQANSNPAAMTGTAMISSFYDANIGAGREARAAIFNPGPQSARSTVRQWA